MPKCPVLTHVMCVLCGEYIQHTAERVQDFFRKNELKEKIGA